MLWHVVVETVNDRLVSKQDAIVLAHTEKSAKALASRAFTRRGYTKARSLWAGALNISTTGVVFIATDGLAVSYA